MLRAAKLPDTGMRSVKGWKDPLFLGIVAVLLTAFIWLHPQGAMRSSGDAQRVDSGSLFAVGSRFPVINAYDEMGVRREVLPRGQAALVIFRADCDCDDTAVRQWTASAARAREQLTIVVATPPHKLAEIRRANKLPGRILAATASEMSRLHLPEERLPLAIHLSTTGTVLAVE